MKTPDRIKVLLFCVLLCSSFALQAAGRTALVIGNSDYQISPLLNPTRDADDMAAALRFLGFDVIHLENITRSELRHGIREFGNKIKQGGVGLFYYAGHGIQVDGENYLIPLGADIAAEDEIIDEAINVSSVLRKMHSAENGLNIVILDACRDNPFARSFRSASSGLAKMHAPSGTIVAYATAPGSTAADGSGENGVYTKHLLNVMQEQSLSIEEVFKKVRVAVKKETAGVQVPWEESSLEGDFYFHKPTLENQPKEATLSAATVIGSQDEGENERLFWESVRDSDDTSMIQAYLDNYPNGKFTSLAKIKVNKLGGNQNEAPEINSTTIETASAIPKSNEEDLNQVLTMSTSLVGKWKGNFQKMVGSLPLHIDVELNIKAIQNQFIGEISIAGFGNGLMGAGLMGASLNCDEDIDIQKTSNKLYTFTLASGRCNDFYPKGTITINTTSENDSLAISLSLMQNGKRGPTIEGISVRKIESLPEIENNQNVQVVTLDTSEGVELDQGNILVNSLVGKWKGNFLNSAGSTPVHIDVNMDIKANQDQFVGGISITGGFGNSLVGASLNCDENIDIQKASNKHYTFTLASDRCNDFYPKGTITISDDTENDTLTVSLSLMRNGKKGPTIEEISLSRLEP